MTRQIRNFFDAVDTAQVSSASSRRPMAIAAWGVLGVSATFLECIARLGKRAMDLLRGGLGPREWALLFVVVLAFGYLEGYLALHKRFAMRVVERAFDLPSSHRAWVCLAPLYVLSLIGAERRALVKAWTGVASIVVVATIVRALPSPWRQMIDAGVVVALSVGWISLSGRFAQRILASTQRT